MITFQIRLSKSVSTLATCAVHGLGDIVSWHGALLDAFWGPKIIGWASEPSHGPGPAGAPYAAR